MLGARLVVLVMLLSGLLGGCGPAASPGGGPAAPAGAVAAPAAAPTQPPRPVVIATASLSAFNWGLYAAEARGLYAELGIAPEWLVTESPPKTAQAF